MICNRCQLAVKSYQVVKEAILSPCLPSSATFGMNCSNYCLSHAKGSPFREWACVLAVKDFFGVPRSNLSGPFAASACPAAISSCCSHPCARWIGATHRLFDTPRTAASIPLPLMKTKIFAGWYWVDWWLSGCLSGRNYCLYLVCFCSQWSDEWLDFHSIRLIGGLHRWDQVRCGHWGCA